MHVVFQLHDVFRFESIVVINVFINISSPKLNNQFFSKLRGHEYAFGLTSTSKAELFCRCKCRKFICQNEVKICELQSQNFKLQGQKIGCPSHHVLATIR